MFIPKKRKRNHKENVYVIILRQVHLIDFHSLMPIKVLEKSPHNQAYQNHETSLILEPSLTIHSNQPLRVGRTNKLKI